MASLGIRLANGNDVLLQLFALLMTEMAIMQVIDVAVVFNRRMTASRTVGMGMFRHNNLRGKKGSGPHCPGL